MRRGFQKYKAKKTYCAAGHFHPSQGEARRCDCLHLLQAASEIQDLKVNPSVTLTVGFRYKPDFSYLERGLLVVEDFKGVETQRFRDIKRMWPHHGKGVLRVSKLRGKKFYIEPDISGKE